ncbi:hypothetical protein [Pelistega ratti]|uniref:deoxynucleotide monophosphate kinase family protein n=1 Tax=Pelistega ratti TaxID=2652177 RepID=UPI001357152D|nr:hypothetical protein [Pelistega ratti]
MSQLCTIIGLCGTAGSGKNTCGDIIQNISPDYIQFAIADPLKYEVANAFQIDDSYLYSRALKESRTYNLAIYRCKDKAFIEVCRSLDIDLYIPQTPRRIMQLWGLEYRRQQNINYWLDLAITYINNLIQAGAKGIVVTDIRFPNEAEMIKSCGGQLVLINRPSLKQQMAHESENIAALTPWIDHVLYNRGTTEEFAEDIQTFLKTQCNIQEK